MIEVVARFFRNPEAMQRVPFGIDESGDVNAYHRGTMIHEDTVVSYRRTFRGTMHEEMPNLLLLKVNIMHRFGRSFIIGLYGFFLTICSLLWNHIIWRFRSKAPWWSRMTGIRPPLQLGTVIA